MKQKKVTIKEDANGIFFIHNKVGKLFDIGFESYGEAKEWAEKNNCDVIGGITNPTPSPSIHEEGKFTKGEWQHVKLGNIQRVRQSTKIICDCYSFSEGISDEEAEANAALIAEAKNMYLFIQEMAKRYANSEWIGGEANKILNRIK